MWVLFISLIFGGRIQSIAFCFLSGFNSWAWLVWNHRTKLSNFTAVKKKLKIASDNSHFRIQPICFAFFTTEFQYLFLSQLIIVCGVFLLERGGKKEGFTLFALLAIGESLCLLSVSHVLLLADFLNRNSVRFHGKVPSNCYAEATKVQW